MSNKKKSIKDRAILPSIIDYENGELDDEQTIELFQRLIDTGIVWQLQGSYGRTAAALIEQGFCAAK